MPRTSTKRKSTAPPNQQPDKTSNGRSGKVKTKELERINNMFDKYANDGIIDPDGIMTLCKDLEMEYTDVRILMLAWKLQAAKLGYFTKDEWQTGLKTLQVDTLSKLKKAVSELEKEASTQLNFADFYSFAFRYHLTEEKQKSIDIETICELLNVVLASQYRRQVDLLIDYLKIQNNYKVINKDQWVNFLRFCNEISFPDLENYDETQAWPLILDNFVEWLRENHR
ncbi:Defective in cullin neddylation protein [Melia azedarach]|uniref:Defective in cullin neddylation protein n=1 Tax=Melia azedarach TaxID=155640 RepID=A0ACC1XE38_MELAZ|nr:Defective in cullin neddylation protein [Melia azedarach]